MPSGYLDEYGEQLLALRPYNGVLTDSNRTDLDVFRYLRATIASARVASPDNLPDLPELNRRLAARRQGASGAANPLAVQYLTYHRIRPDALQLNLLRVQNNQVYDVPGRSQSPYQAATLFAAAPLYSISRTGSVSFVFASNLYLTNNVGIGVYALALDFDNGRGYVNAAWDQPVSTVYTSLGHKHIKVRITYRGTNPAPAASQTAAQQAAPVSPTFSLVSHFDLEVVQLAAPAARYPATDNITRDFTSATGAHDGATVSVRYGRGHTGMTKPFIVVEQYNVAAILEKLAPDLIPCDNANNTINSFLDKITNIASFDFNDHLQNDGQYDLVYIDFKHNTDDIRRNAVLFQEVVRWVNELKRQNGSTEQNVVMGQSMGGLISRYGLAQMVRNRENPQVRLLVLHDSPQRGAYSPVGTQSLTRALDKPFIFGAAVTSFSKTAEAAVAILNEPASQQLSILNAYDSGGNIKPDPFLDGQYRQVISFAPSDPVQPVYSIIATSDGSQCGQAQNTPVGVTLASTTGDSFLRPLSYLPFPLNLLSNFNLKADGIARGLPAYGQQAEVSHLRIYVQYNLCIGYGPFKACIPLVSVNLLNESAPSPANTLPYETLPGGYINPHDNADCSPGIDYYVPFLFRIFLKTTLYDGAICFVPSYSALDVPTVSPATAYAKYINNATSSPSQPSVIRYIAQERVSSTLFNQPHIRFTARNSEWIYDQMQGLPLPSSYCSIECSAVANLNITGPLTLCNPATYTSPIQAPGYTYTWSATPASLFTVSSGTGPTFQTAATNRNVSNGGTIRLVVNTGCQVQFALNVVVGVPDVPGVYQTDDLSTCTYNTAHFQLTNFDPALTYTVTASPGYTITTARPLRSNLIYGERRHRQPGRHGKSAGAGRMRSQFHRRHWLFLRPLWFCLPPLPQPQQRRADHCPHQPNYGGQPCRWPRCQPRRPRRRPRQPHAGAPLRQLRAAAAGAGHCARQHPAPARGYAAGRPLRGGAAARPAAAWPPAASGAAVAAALLPTQTASGRPRQTRAARTIRRAGRRAGRGS